MAHLLDVCRKITREFSKFDPGPEIGDAQAADGAMTSHEKNRGNKSFSNLGNMHNFIKPCISGTRKYINQAYSYDVLVQNGTRK
jgi:hypothetical protein